MQKQSNRPVDWETLVTENENRLYRAALAILGDRQEAQDAVQDAFLRYLEKAPERLDDPAAWLMRVLVNRCRDICRRSRRRGTVPLLQELPVPGPEERQELEELYALPPPDRAVIHLRYCEGRSTAEIARILGVREGTVRSRLARARARLRRLLEDAER
ncbi:MAG: sigma-70 family RNA polymerase sigma factor [Lawsonibacter sp.]|nr:sigma-70 family RNA polymerase sigma factor [Lawsonibacter sp.]